MKIKVDGDQAETVTVIIHLFTCPKNQQLQHYAKYLGYYKK